MTRAARNPWKELRETGSASGTLLVDDHVEGLRLAVWSKASRADPDITLVIDSTGTPHFGDTKVVEEFRKVHGRDAAGLGFAGIWLAAQTAQRTVRLDGLPP